MRIREFSKGCGSEDAAIRSTRMLLRHGMTLPDFTPKKIIRSALGMHADDVITRVVIPRSRIPTGEFMHNELYRMKDTARHSGHMVSEREINDIAASAILQNIHEKKKREKFLKELKARRKKTTSTA